MALTKCPDCGKEVSARAQTCIHCGGPIGIAKSTEAVQTIQETSKELKVQKIGAVLTMIAGMGSCMTFADSDVGLEVSALIMIIGLVWYIGVSAAAWWGHG